jgi:hypothetical protein
MAASRTAWLVFCAALAACKPPEEPQSSAPPPEPQVSEPAQPEPDLPPPPQAPEPKPESLASYPDSDPETLLNRDTAEIADILGTPAKIEDQAPALIWVYEATDVCMLRLFFYPQLDGDRFLSLTYEITPAPDRNAEQLCIATLRRAHAG